MLLLPKSSGTKVSMICDATWKAIPKRSDSLELTGFLPRSDVAHYSSQPLIDEVILTEMTNALMP